MGDIVIAAVLLASALSVLIKREARQPFFEGAERGAKNALRLAPSLALLMGGVGMLRASGFSRLAEAPLRRVLSVFGIPGELVSFMLIRPFSGAGGISVLTDIYTEYGADSFVGMCASVISASSDTVLYIIPLYFASCRVSKSRYAVPLALLISFADVLLSVAVVRLFGCYERA